MKFTVANRYNHKHTLETFQGYATFKPDKDISYLSTGGAIDFIEFIDPEGGPFIAVGTILSGIHSKAPPLYITKIKFIKSKKHYKFYVNENKPTEKTPIP